MSAAAEETASPRPVRPAPPRGRSRFVRVLCVLCWILAAYWFARTGIHWTRQAAPDFEYFYKGGAALLHHGVLDPGYDVTPAGQVVARGSIEWYLPFVSRLMTLLAWMPHWHAGLVWLALSLVAMFAAARLVGRYLSGRPPRDWPVTQLLPLLALGLFWYWEYRLNQINSLTLLLLVGSFACWQQRRHGASGLWLGLAVLVKVTPALLLLWFALKRQFRVVGAAVVTIVLAGPVGDLIAFGPAGALDCNRAWFHHAVACGSNRGLILSQTEMDWRNQGLGAVASRWLHPTNYNTRYDNDPRFAAAPGVLSMNVAQLSRESVAWIVTGVHAVSIIGLVWLARRPAEKLTFWQVRLEWALFVLAMLWFMPVMRGYHLIWAYPATAVLAGAAGCLGWRHRWSIKVLLLLGAVVCGQVSLLWMEANAGGAILGIVLVLALPMAVLVLRLQRHPAALPEDSRAAAPAAAGGTGDSREPRSASGAVAGHV